MDKIDYDSNPVFGFDISFHFIAIMWNMIADS